MANGCDERGAGEKFILRVASLLDYSDRLLGIFILVWMRLSGNESWLSKAADIIEEREESQAVESK